MLKAPDALAQLTEARQEDLQMSIEIYCGNCPARQIEITIKDDDDSLLGLIANRGFTCPVCGAACKLHHALTASEYVRKYEREARWNVNAQMYKRDEGTTAVPVGIMVDDRLPTTPPNWWE